MQVWIQIQDQIQDQIKTDSVEQIYRVDGVYVAQETERNKATAKYVALPSCAWLLLSIFPFPVRHPLHPLCTYTDTN